MSITSAFSIEQFKTDCVAIVFFQADASLFNQTASPDKLPNQHCLLPSIPEHAQRTLRDVTNLVILPLDTLLALLSVTFNTVILVAILRTRSIQHPSMLLLGSLSVTDLIWAIKCSFQNTKFFLLKNLCPKETTGEVFAGILCFFSTLGSLAIISCDRLLAVSNPWWYRSHATTSYAVKEITLVWLISVILAGLGSSYKHLPSVWSIFPYLGTALSVCSALTIIVCYIGVLVANCRHRASMHLHGGPMRTVLKREKKIANTVVLILIVFGITLFPVINVPLALHHFGITTRDTTPLRPFYYIFVTLNGLLNPILNYGRNKDVRRAVRSLIRCHRCCEEVRHGCDVDNEQRRRNLFCLRRHNRVTADSHQITHNDRVLRMQNTGQSKRLERGM